MSVVGLGLALEQPPLVLALHGRPRALGEHVQWRASRGGGGRRVHGLRGGLRGVELDEGEALERARRQQARQADVAEPSAAAEELLDRLVARVCRQRLDVHRALLSHSK